MRRQRTLTNCLAQRDKFGKISNAIYGIGEVRRPATALVVLRQVVAKAGMQFEAIED